MADQIRILVKTRKNIHSMPVGSMVLVTIKDGSKPDLLDDWRDATPIEREIYANGITTVPSTKDL